MCNSSLCFVQQGRSGNGARAGRYHRHHLRSPAHRPADGRTSADAPTLITLGGDITIPAGGDNNNPPINGSGHFKIDGGGHTLTWEGEGNNFHFLGNSSPDADAVYIELTNINLVRQGMNSAVGVYNGRITLGKDVALNGQYET